MPNDEPDLFEEIIMRRLELNLPSISEFPYEVQVLYQEYIRGERLMVVWDLPEERRDCYFYQVKPKENK